MEMQAGMLRQYKDEICSLEEEIRLLTKQCQNQAESTHLTDEHLQLVLGRLAASSTTSQNTADLKAELSYLGTEVDYLKELTGLSFTEYTRRTLESNESRSLLKYRLAGSCDVLLFQLEFELLQDLEKGRLSSVVTKLNIIMDSGEQADLGEFVSKMEERNNILLFFRTLSLFSELSGHRKATFRRFKGQYPDLVRLPEGSSAKHMVIRTPQLPGCELLIVWNIHVNEEGAVTSVLDLLTKMPKRALALDKKKAIERAPGCFRTLLQVYGIEAAIEHLIKAFTMQE
ncbi:centromere protein P [Ambystoma mexicanum]|uniref:centromere protein P n=1 Tax=Ambystoma mexicanum TaxID=8296 RepID=UPI0037E986A7